MKIKTLFDWLAWIETLHPRTIDLGLERVHAVLDRMGLRKPGFAAISVSGTNGKGSTVAMAETILRQAGYKVGAYTSPHLVRYNERVRIEGRIVSDAELCTAFEHIESVRGDIPLTYFEFGTLAAFDIFHSVKIDIAVFEVGMGGRLDAVNAIDADVAIISSVDIDHTSWLGTTREAIGREKAGIFRQGRPAICSDPQPPAIVADEAHRVGATLLQVNRDFSIERHAGGWTWRSGKHLRSGLPHPALRGDYQLFNAAGVLMALETLGGLFPVSQAHIRAGLLSAVIPGRFHVLPGLPLRVFDVAHNPQAARSLAATLKQQQTLGRTLAVLGILRDKDVAGVISALSPIVDRWYAATLDIPRGASAAELIEILSAAGVSAVQGFDDVHQAYEAAIRDATEADRIVVFGSFHTVGDILAAIKEL